MKPENFNDKPETSAVAPDLVNKEERDAEKRIEALYTLAEMEKRRVGETRQYKEYLAKAEKEKDELMREITSQPQSFSLIEKLNQYRKKIILPAIFGTILDISGTLSQAFGQEVKSQGEPIKTGDQITAQAENHRADGEVETWLKSIKNDPFRKPSDLADHVNSPWFKDVILKLSEDDPELILQRIDQSVRSIARYRNLKNRILLELSTNKSPSYSKILAIEESGLNKEEKASISPLLDEMVNGNLSVDSAATLSKDPQALYNKLIEIKAKAGHLGDSSLDRALKDYSLRTINTINDLHDETNQEIRFASVKNATPEKLYSLIVYGDNETYTSTFNGLFDRLLSDKDFSPATFKKVGYNHFRTFIKLCSQFNRLDDLFNKMPDSELNLLQDFSKNLEKEKSPVEQAVAVADSISGLRNPKVFKLLKNILKDEFLRLEKENNRKGKNIYGLLASLISSRDSSEENDLWFENIQREYKLKSLDSLGREEISNPDGTIVQQMFFYNDEDGRGTFDMFVKQYKKDQKNWSIEDHDGFIKISGIGKSQKIEIYANKPGNEKDGPEKITAELQSKKLKTNIIIHRGHSTHVDDTIEKMPSSAKIVFLGACGGYKYLEKVLKVIPDAHIVSTKGKGTVSVNEPLLKILNDEVSLGQGITWQKLWQKAQTKLGKIEGFSNYIPPNNNLGVKMLQAINKLN